jgi:amino acid permease
MGGKGDYKLPAPVLLAEGAIDESIELQSAIKTGMNVMKTTIGAGMFAAAYACEAGGFLFGLIIIIGLAIVFYFVFLKV